MKAIPSSEYDPEEYYSRRFKIVDLPAGLHDLTEVEVVVQPSGEGNVSKAIAVDSIVVPLFKAAPELLAALHKIDANAGESVEWIRRTAREAITNATFNS
jgi:hypothetical protein